MPTGASVAASCGGHADGEARLALGLDPLHLDVLDAGARRAAPAPLDHRLHALVVALEGGLDGSVGNVANPARDAERARPVTRLRPKEDALDDAADDDACPLHFSKPPSADERHEPARDRAHDRRALGAAHDQLQPLAPAPTDRHGEAATRLELVVELLRQARRRRRDRDRVERRVLRQAERPVSDVDVDPLVPGRGEVLPGLLGELGNPLDRVHLRGQLGEDCGLVAGAGADVEHALAAGEAEDLADPGDHVRLRDRLVVTDRQRGVGECSRPFSAGDEELPRHVAPSP